MAQRGDIPINNFVKGLVTEASPLTFPQGASLDEVNFVLKRDGSRERRLGLDLEENYGLHDLGLSSEVLEGARCQAYRWSIPNGDIEQDIGVIQTGNRIWFIDLYTQNPSANILNGGNPISVTEVDNSVIMTFTTINNYLVGVANQLIQPYLFTYDADTDTVTTETAAIAVRDLWGVDDGLDINGRPTTLSAVHHYNLLNQGWVTEIQSTCGAGIDAIDCTFNTFGIYPSNSDQWSLGRIEDLTSADVNKFDPNVASRNLVSTGQAPRGHFVIDLFNRGTSRSTQTGLTLPVDRETGRITAIAAYAGRIFYGGILSKVAGGDNRSPNLGGSVLFSQLFENKINLVKCYQEADPTSPDINDIVDTDGGLIQIPECSYIFALKAIRESLFVFAANGVWEIRGGENVFTATSFMVNKISNVGVYAPKSIVEVEGTIFFWAATGIHAIARNKNGVFETTNLTLPTIQTLYNAIPDASKKNARGYHDLSQNRARWLYYSPESKRFGEAIDISDTPVVPPAIVSIGTSATAPPDTASNVRVVMINASTYLVTYSQLNSPYHLKGFVVSVAADLSLTLGSVVTINASDSRSDFNLCLIDTNKVLFYYGKNPGSSAFARILTISGTTFTVGAENTLFASTTHANVSVVKLTSTKAIAIYRPSPTPCAARVLTISGDTVTASSATNINTATGVGQAIRLSDNRVFLVYDQGGNKALVITESGGSLALGTPYDVASNFSAASLSSIKGALHPNGVLVTLSTRESSGFVRYFSLSMPSDTITADLASVTTSSAHDTPAAELHGITVVGVNLAADVASNVANGYPTLEVMTASAGSTTVKYSNQILESVQTRSTDMRVIKLSASLIAWVGIRGTSGGNVATQVVSIS